MGARTAWTAELEAIARRLKARGLGVEDIAAALGRKGLARVTAQAVKRFFQRQDEQALLADESGPVDPPGRIPGTPWSRKELRAMSLRALAALVKHHHDHPDCPPELKAELKARLAGALGRRR